MPLVSVLLPIHNDGAYLPAALDSLVRQRFGDWECLVADDGSTDDTAAILERYAASDARIRPLRLPHRGIVPTLNDALATASGRFVARMDADDVCHPARLAEQVAFFEANPDLALVSCLLRKFPRPELKLGMLRYEEWLNSLVTPHEIARDIFVESPLCHPTVMMRRDDLARLGGWRDTAWAEDYDLWLRLHLAGGRIAKVPRTLFFWRERDTRLSRTSARYGLDAFRACKIRFLSEGPLRGHRRVVVWGAGRTGKRFALALQDAGFEIAAFVDLDPRKIGQNVHGAFVIRPEGLPAFRGVPVLAAVGKDGARELIRGDLRGMGFTEGVDYWCVA